MSSKRNLRTSDRFGALATSESARIRQHTASLTVTSLPATSIGCALVELRPDIATRLYRGIRVEKVCSNGRAVPRILTLSRGNFVLFVTPRKVPGVRRAASADRTREAAFEADALAQRVRDAPRFAREKTRERKRRLAPRHVDIADVTGVQRGFVGTQKLELSRDRHLFLPIATRDQGCRIFSSRRKTRDEVAIVSIIHGDQDTLDLLIRNKVDRSDFLDALCRIRATYHKGKINVSREELLLRYVWYGVDLNRNGRIEPSELVKILDRINLYQKKGVTKQRYREFMRELHANDGHRRHHLLHHNKGLTFEQCMEFLRRQKLDACGIDDDGQKKTMEDKIWDWVFGGDIHSVSAEDFLTKFLHGAQGECDASAEDVRVIFAHLNSMEVSCARSAHDKKEYGPTGWELDGVPQIQDTALSIDRVRFAEYLHSEVNNLYDPDCLKIDTSSLDEPLSAYWINTSHNTYLTGDQLQSFSSVEMYMRALRRGCKCLELDCWDGGEEEDSSGGGQKRIPIPVVYHGYTVTTKIRFADIVRCVRCYVDSHPDTYPIILSLENHCTTKYQDVMAKVLTNTLGDTLYTPNQSNIEGSLPSPASLRGKVIIKGKRPLVPGDKVGGDDDPYENDLHVEAGDSAKQLEESMSSGQKTGNRTDGIMTETKSFNERREETVAQGLGTQGCKGGENKDGDKKKAHQPKIAPALAAVTFFHGTKYKRFEMSIEEPTSHMHSISEPKIAKILSDPPAVVMWRQYNKHHMTRTYPAGSRIDSSNYNPVLPWSTGCQLVALNFQTPDAPLVVNDGRIRENGGCGYVRKPQSVMGTAAPQPLPKTLRIRVLSGSCLPKPKWKAKGDCINPYVKITLHDVASAGVDGSGGVQILSYFSETHRTRTVRDNGFCPVWNEQSFSKLVVQSPDVALVQFTVKDEDTMGNVILAEAAIPVNRLRNGYRCVKLFNQNGERPGPFDFATLLVKATALDH